LKSLSAAWDDRLSELADYRKTHGDCNVPQRYSENKKLGTWVQTQRNQYKLQQEGKRSRMTPLRIQALESLGFEWDCRGDTWDELLNELADYRKTHGDCNVPQRYSENKKLGTWVQTQRNQYRLHLEEMASFMPTHRIQELESLGFEWDYRGDTWDELLSELADYHKIHGHCNVPQYYSENNKLGGWVQTQRKQYKLHLKGMSSFMTTYRIQKLESLGFFE
jgi:hypothetical protein